MIAGGPHTVSVSVDLDAPLDYCRFYRVAVEPPSDPFLDEALGFLGDLFAELGIRATFFAIARDLGGPAARRRLRELAAAGHEIANHSFSHPHAFRKLPRARREEEIDRAHQAIEEVTGSPVVGFRSPAYDLDRELLDLLLDRGYLYDSSLNPTPFLLPMKWVVQLKARRWRVGLGRFLHGFADRRPHFCWRENGQIRSGRRPGAGRNLVELPLSVVPGIRFPFYGTITQVMGLAGFRAGLAAIRRGRLPINYGLHAAEVAPPTPEALAGAGAPEPAPGAPVSGHGRSRAVPGYAASVESCRRRLRESLTLLVAGARAVPLAELARSVAAEAGGAPA